MKFSKILAAVSAAAAFVLAWSAFPAPGLAGADCLPPGPGEPQVQVLAQDSGSAAQSLTALPGGAFAPQAKPGSLPGAKNTLTTTWVLQKDTVVSTLVYVDKSEIIDLNGHTLTVYGALSINGDQFSHGALNVNGGKLLIKNNNSFANSGTLYIDGGLLIMKKSADYCETERSAVFDAADETGSLTAGTLKVGGHFLQLNDFSDKSYNESETHTTVFAGAGALAQFLSPLGSGVRNLTMASGASFTSADTDVPVYWVYVKPDGSVVWQVLSFKTSGGTFLCLKSDLSADFTLAVPNLYYLGAQGPWALNVSGSLIVPAGATQSVTGNLSAANVYCLGAMSLAAAGKTVSASGSFCVEAGGALNLSAGSVSTGDFEDARGTLSATADSGKTIQVTRCGPSAIALSGSPVNLSGDLDGRSLAVSGSLAVPAGAALTLGASTASVSGAMAVKGLLDMQDASGVLRVGADFTAEGGDSWTQTHCSLAKGTLLLGGDFTQKGTLSPRSFCPAEGFNTILLDGSHALSFENPAEAGEVGSMQAQKSWFGTLVSFNPADASLDGIPAYSKSFQTLLDGIGVAYDGGTAALSPAFDRGVFSYTADVPASAADVTVTPVQGSGCATCLIDGKQQDSVALHPEPDGSAQTTMTLSDSTGAYAWTYTLTVRRAPLLTGIAVTAVADGKPVRVDLPFASATAAYAVDLPADSSSIEVTAAGTDGVDVQVTGNDPDVSAGGSRDVTVTASAGPGAPQQASYTVTVRKPLLEGLGFSPEVQASAPFDTTGKAATKVTIPWGWPGVTLLPQANLAGGGGTVECSYADNNGNDVPEGVVTLGQGDTRNILIKATYTQNGVPYEQDYPVAVTRALSDDADLKGIGASTGYLSPAFDAATLTYTLTIPETAPSVTVTPAVDEPGAHYRIDSGAADTPKTVTLALNGSATLHIAVTARNGSAQRAYTLTVRKSAMVASFTGSPVYAGYASLSPGGTNRMTVSFSLNLPASVTVDVKKGSKWYTLLTRAEAQPGADSFTWDGSVAGKYLSSGTYYLRITPSSGGKTGTQKTIKIKILPKPSVSVPSLSPSAFLVDGVRKLTLTAKWTRLTDVAVLVVDASGNTVKVLYMASNKAPGSAKLTWDGRDAGGSLVPAGAYRIEVLCGGAKAVYRKFTVKR